MKKRLLFVVMLAITGLSIQAQNQVAKKVMEIQNLNVEFFQKHSCHYSGKMGKSGENRRK